MSASERGQCPHIETAVSGAQRTDRRIGHVLVLPSPHRNDLAKLSRHDSRVLYSDGEETPNSCQGTRKTSTSRWAARATRRPWKSLVSDPVPNREILKWMSCPRMGAGRATQWSAGTRSM